MAGYLGAGDLYVAIEVDGVMGALEGPFSANKYEIQPAATVRENKSKGKTTYGQVLDSAALAEPASFTVELKQLDRVGMVMALAGNLVTVTQASGSIGAGVTVEAVHDKWVEVPGGFKNFTTLAVTGETAGVDYEVNLALGLIKALSTGSIADGADMTITGSYAAITADKIEGAKQAQIRARFVFDGKNFVTGKPFQAEIYRGVVAAQTAIDLLADDFIVVPLTGRMETPAGKTSPFEVTAY